MTEDEQRKLALQLAQDALLDYECLNIVEVIKMDYPDLDDYSVDTIANDVSDLIAGIKLTLPSTNIM